jgi:hypothetical protein
MKSASNRIRDTRQFPFTGENQSVVSDLRYVAKTFAELQEQRHVADYDNAQETRLTVKRQDTREMRRVKWLWITSPLGFGPI